MPTQTAHQLQPLVYTTEQLAAELQCSEKTVEDWARRGLLPGLKPGGSWVFPAAALAAGLAALATEEAAKRRKPTPPTAVSGAAIAAAAGGAQPTPATAARGRKRRPLPRLVELRGAP